MTSLDGNMEIQHPVLIYLNKKQENLIRSIFQKNNWSLLIKVLSACQLQKLGLFNADQASSSNDAWLLQTDPGGGSCQITNESETTVSLDSGIIYNSRNTGDMSDHSNVSRVDDIPQYADQNNWGTHVDKSTHVNSHVSNSQTKDMNVYYENRNTDYDKTVTVKLEVSGGSFENEKQDSNASLNKEKNKDSKSELTYEETVRQETHNNVIMRPKPGTRQTQRDIVSPSVSDKIDGEKMKSDEDNDTKAGRFNEFAGSTFLIRLAVAEGVDSVIKSLERYVWTKPASFGQLLHTCCSFLMEKVEEFANWCKDYVNKKDQHDERCWKTTVLALAHNGDLHVVNEVMLALKHLSSIVLASVDIQFINSVSNFLTSAKLLMTATSSIPPVDPYSQAEDKAIDNQPQDEHDNSSLSEDEQRESFTFIGKRKHKRVPFNPKWKLSRHSHKFPGELTVPCLYCDKMFHNQKNVQYHMSKAHPEHADLNECFTCKKQFIFKKDLHEHGLSTKHKTNSFMCEKCGKDLSSYSGFKFHMMSVHNWQEDAQRFTCEICSKTFKRKVGLEAHNKRCHSDETFYCDVCGRGFTSKVNMMSHRIRHDEENKRYSCPGCGKKFFCKTNMMNHNRIHTGEKPFKCPLCDYRCSFKNNIAKHMKVHKK